MSSVVRAVRPVLRLQGLRSAASQTASFATGTDVRVTPDIKDVKTHTGQTFTEGDYRLVKFNGKEKQVNTRFAIDLIAEVAPIAVNGRSTFCDGGDGPLGHPRVFINLDQPGNHTCGYCGLRFFQHGSHDSH